MIAGRANLARRALQGSSCILKASYHQAIVYNSHGDPSDVLSVENGQLEDPSGSPEKCITVNWLAAAVNPSDINQIEGTYPLKPASFPATPGTEGVGIVTDTGTHQGSSALCVGDKVVPGEPLLGTWRKSGRYSASQLVKLESSAAELPIGAAATITINPATAWRMLMHFPGLASDGDLSTGRRFLRMLDHADKEASSHVVVQNGANSVVGQLVIQISKLLGWKTVNIVRDRPGLDDLKEQMSLLGADLVTTEEHLRTELKGCGLPKPLLALNAVGGSSSLRIAGSLGHGGLMLTYGGLSRKSVQLPTGSHIFKDVTSKGFWLSGRERSSSTVKEDIHVATQLWERGVRWRWKYWDLADVKDALAAPKSTPLSEKTVLLTQTGKGMVTS